MALPQEYLPALTGEQYLEIERFSEIRHEYLDGLVYAMAGESRDRTQIESLQDYVMVSQDQARNEHHHRQTDDTWTSIEVNGLDGVLVLASIDCRIPLTEVYRHTKVGT